MVGAYDPTQFKSKDRIEFKPTNHYYGNPDIVAEKKELEKSSAYCTLLQGMYSSLIEQMEYYRSFGKLQPQKVCGETPIQLGNGKTMIYTHPCDEEISILKAKQNESKPVELVADIHIRTDFKNAAETETYTYEFMEAAVCLDLAEQARKLPDVKSAQCYRKHTYFMDYTRLNISIIQRELN